MPAIRRLHTKGPRTGSHPRARTNESQTNCGIWPLPGTRRRVKRRLAAKQASPLLQKRPSTPCHDRPERLRPMMEGPVQESARLSLFGNSNLPPTHGHHPFSLPNAARGRAGVGFVGSSLCVQHQLTLPPPLTDLVRAVFSLSSEARALSCSQALPCRRHSPISAQGGAM